MSQPSAAKRSYSATNPTMPQYHKYRKTEPQPSSRGPPKLGEDQTTRRYAELQNDLQQIFSDCNELWKSSWRFSDRIEDGFRKSWKAAMENFELLLRVVLDETITSEDSKGLCLLWRGKLGNAATMLWANNHNSTETVWKDHTTHLQAVTQAISEQVCWKTILDELQTNETLTENARRQQTTYLKTKIYEQKSNYKRPSRRQVHTQRHKTNMSQHTQTANDRSEQKANGSSSSGVLERAAIREPHMTTKAVLPKPAP